MKVLRPFWPFLIPFFAFILTSCGTGSSMPVLGDAGTLALPPSTSFVMPNITIPASIPYFPTFVTMPLPADFSEQVMRISEGESTTLTADYDQAGTTTGDPNQDPNDPCSNKPGYPPNARSTVHHDAADNTITRTVYTADGQKIGFIQSALMNINGQETVIHWMQVESAFQGRGIATHLIENSITDFARFYPDKAQTLITFADKNALGYKCFWSRNAQHGTLNDNGEQLPYTKYNPNQTYYQSPPAPGAGEFQIPPANTWVVPVMPQPENSTGPRT